MILEARDLTYSYRKASSPVLDHVSAAFDEGKFHAIVGASGSGKTTLLALLARARCADAGRNPLRRRRHSQDRPLSASAGTRRARFSELQPHRLPHRRGKTCVLVALVTRLPSSQRLGCQQRSRAKMCSRSVVGSSSASPLRERLPVLPACSSPTSRQAIWTKPQQAVSSIFCSERRTIAENVSSPSPTARCWRLPPISCCGWKAAGYLEQNENPDASASGLSARTL